MKLIGKIVLIVVAVAAVMFVGKIIGNYFFPQKCVTASAEVAQASLPEKGTTMSDTAPAPDKAKTASAKSEKKQTKKAKTVKKIAKVEKSDGVVISSVKVTEGKITTVDATAGVIVSQPITFVVNGKVVERPYRTSHRGSFRQGTTPVVRTLTNNGGVIVIAPVTANFSVQAGGN